MPTTSVFPPQRSVLDGFVFRLERNFTLNFNFVFKSAQGCHRDTLRILNPENMWHLNQQQLFLQIRFDILLRLELILEYSAI